MKRPHIAKPSHLLYGLDDAPPPSSLAILAVEHTLVLISCLVATLFFAIEIGATEDQTEAFVDIALIAGGLTSIVQAIPGRWVGSGYFCLHSSTFLYMQCSILAAQKGGLPLVFGMTAFAGVMQALFSRVIVRLRVLFPPEVSGLVVASVGMAMAPYAVRSMTGIQPNGGITDPTIGIVGVATFLLIVGLSVWGRNTMRLYFVLIGFVFGYALSYFLCLIPEASLSHIGRLPLVSMPSLSFEGYDFDASFAVPFMVAALCASLKLIGDLVTCQKMNDPEWKRTDMVPIGKGIVTEGIGTFLSGVLGGTALAASSSNIGMSYATGATSRRIGYTTGALLISLAFSPKIVAIVAQMPHPVVGAIVMYASCFMIAAGWGIVMTRMMDARRMFVIGITVVMGLSVEFAPALYTGVDPMLKPVFASSVSISALTAIVLTMIFRIGISKRLSLSMRPGIDTSEKIYAFFEEAGALWGARVEVVHLAMASVIELFEAVSTHGTARGTIETEAAFDEFTIEVNVRYEGEEIPFPEAMPHHEEILDDDRALMRMSGFLIRHYATEMKCSRSDGICLVSLRFDH